MKFDKDNFNIAIIGLGYVGLPLAVEFSKQYKVIGFDINLKRIEFYHNGVKRYFQKDVNLFVLRLKKKNRCIWI